MNEKELKPCPICQQTDFDILELESPDKTVTFYKLLHSPQSPCGISMMRDNKDELIEAWNTRQPQSGLSDEEIRSKAVEYDDNCFEGGYRDLTIQDHFIAGAMYRTHHSTPLTEEKAPDTRLVKALETIRDAFWTDGEDHEERIEDLQEIAEKALIEAKDKAPEQINTERLISKAHSNILRRKGNPKYAPDFREIGDEILKSNAHLFQEHPLNEMYNKDKDAILKCILDSLELSFAPEQWVSVEDTDWIRLQQNTQPSDNQKIWIRGETLKGDKIIVKGHYLKEWRFFTEK